MADTYTQSYIHVIFAVESLQSLIAPEHNDELQKYITGIVTERHKLIAINNMPDHLHALRESAARAVPCKGNNFSPVSR